MLIVTKMAMLRYIVTVSVVCDLNGTCGTTGLYYARQKDHLIVLLFMYSSAFNVMWMNEVREGRVF
jgi:hypothetical protein